METETFVVICKDEGEYVLATREVFPNREEAEHFVVAIAPGREPLVIPGRWRSLRFDRVRS